MDEQERAERDALEEELERRRQNKTFLEAQKKRASSHQPHPNPNAHSSLPASPHLQPIINLPDTTDLKELAASGIPHLVRKAIEMAALSDNLPQVLAVLKELTDRVHGKPEQSVSSKIEVKDTTELPDLSALARGVAAMLQAANIRSRSIIDIEPTPVPSLPHHTPHTPHPQDPQD